MVVLGLLAAATAGTVPRRAEAGERLATAAGGIPVLQTKAERSIYKTLDASLYFVGALRIGRDGAIAWSSVAGGESGSILCRRDTTSSFRCNWSAQLVQSYTGVAVVTYRGASATVNFTHSTCENPDHDARGFPNLCMLNPIPGMAVT